MTFGWAVLSPGRDHVLRVGWRVRRNVWIPIADADFKHIGTGNEAAVYLTEDMATAAAQEMGGVAVPVVDVRR